MRKFLLVGVGALALMAVKPANAITFVECVNCSTIAEQVLSYGKQLLQLEQEIRIAEQEVLNTLSLPGTVFRDITGDIRRMMGLANQANMLLGNTRGMLSDLANASGYPAGSMAQWQNQLASGSNAISLAMRAAAAIMQEQQGNLNRNSATLSNLQQQALGTEGRQATLQTIAGITAAIGQGVQSQHTTSIAATQAMLTYYTAQAARESYIRRLTTAQQIAGIQASCTAAVATGHSAPPLCANLNQGGQ